MSKGDLLRRTAAIVMRLRRMRSHNALLQQQVEGIEKILDLLEEDLSEQIDSYMANVYEAYFRHRDIPRPGVDNEKRKRFRDRIIERYREFGILDDGSGSTE